MLTLVFKPMYFDSEEYDQHVLGYLRLRQTTTLL